MNNNNSTVVDCRDLAHWLTDWLSLCPDFQEEKFVMLSREWKWAFSKDLVSFFSFSDQICLSPNSVFLVQKGCIYYPFYLWKGQLFGKRKAIMEVHIVRGCQTKVNGACGNFGKIGFLSTCTRSLYWLQGSGCTAGFLPSKTALYSVPMCLLLHTELWPDICWWHKIVAFLQTPFATAIAHQRFVWFGGFSLVGYQFLSELQHFTALTSRLCSISSASVCQSP
jgi:hypothetical protein